MEALGGSPACGTCSCDTRALLSPPSSPPALTCEPTFPELSLQLPKPTLPVLPGIHSWRFWLKRPRSHWPGVVLVTVDFSELSPATAHLREKASAALKYSYFASLSMLWGNAPRSEGKKWSMFAFSRYCPPASPTTCNLSKIFIWRN